MNGGCLLEIVVLSPFDAVFQMGINCLIDNIRNLWKNGWSLKIKLYVTPLSDVLKTEKKINEKNKWSTGNANLMSDMVFHWCSKNRTK